MAQVVESTPKGPHVSFAHQLESDATSSTVHTSQAAHRIDDPSTPPPPPTSTDLPTPPDSHIDVSTSTQPAAFRHHSSQEIQPDASTSQSSPNALQSTSAIDLNQSPSMQVHQRRAHRVSGGTSSPGGDTHMGNQEVAAQLHILPVSERQNVLAEAAEERGRRRGRKEQQHNGDKAYDRGESDRSRTPSPILGSIEANGHLSFAASFLPSAEEVRSLLYSPDGDRVVPEEEERSSIVKKDDMDSLLTRVASMGLANVAEDTKDSDMSKEQELARMVKRLVAHSKQQERYIDSVEKSLHDTRIRSISLLTSLRTTFAHTLAAEYSLRARVESELEGARLQAKKLSVMLARSESRNEEIDRERAMSAEEEVLWQEEMKDHASAYAQQQAARARASQMAQAQSHGHRAVASSELVKVEAIAAEPEVAQDGQAIRSPRESPSPASAMKRLEEPFEDRRGAGDETAVTGLGISSSGTISAAAIDSQLNLSPLSTIVKERNKLLSDKRHLKSRVRDIEAQRDRLEAELKSMRPLLVRGGASKAASISAVAHTTPSQGVAPSTPGKSHKRDRSRRRRQATMGDAEAEHLLLAARRLKEINKSRNVGDDGRPRTPPSVATPSSTLMRTPKTPRTVASQTPRSTAARDGLDSVHQSGASSRIMPNGSPLASRNTGPASLGRWGGHERVDSAVSASGIDDLLQAAQTVLTPEKKAAHKQSHSRSKSGADIPESDEEDRDGDETLLPARSLLPGVSFSTKDFAPLNESPKRRRVSTAGLELDRSRKSWDASQEKRGSMFQSAGRRLRTSTEGAEPQASQSSAGLSALDLLADQAAASQHPSQSSDPSHSGEGEAVLDAEDYGSDYDEEMVDEEEEAPRPTEEGLIGGHYYPRGAYGHPYAQQSKMIPHEMYRSPNQSGYTYAPTGMMGSPVNASHNGQGWSSQNSLISSGGSSMYAPRGGSPTPNGSRFSGGMGYHTSPHRLSTGHADLHHHASKNIQSHSDDGNGNGGNGGRNQAKGGNTSPDKRLPYVRWSDEEDQKLRKAIREFGQRWESVARVVGTRSYHQCRQRYLLMRRKEAAAREGNTSEDSRSVHQVATGAH